MVIWGLEAVLSILESIIAMMLNIIKTLMIFHVHLLSVKTCYDIGAGKFKDILNKGV